MVRKKRQKTNINIALKLAITACHPRQQRDIAMAARIGEVRLSKIVNGAEPTEREQVRLAKVLGRARAELFPALDEAVAS